jgi:hypothetical protein
MKFIASARRRGAHVADEMALIAPPNDIAAIDHESGATCCNNVEF